MNAIPVNVVTATFLDPRRYKRYAAVWLVLGAVSTVNWLSFAWFWLRSAGWNQTLRRWRDRLRNDARHRASVGWFPFKYDLDDSAAETALDYVMMTAQAQQQSQQQPHASSPPPPPPPPPILTVLGASYVAHPNVVFPPSAAEVDELDYRQLAAADVPWRSRFLRAPLQMPTAAEIDELVPDTDDSGMREDPVPIDPPEYEFARVLRQVESQPVPELTFEQRADHILNDIEADRRRIVQQVLREARLIGSGSSGGDVGSAGGGGGGGGIGTGGSNSSAAL